MRRAPLLVISAALALGLPGCTFLNKLFKNEPSSGSSSASSGSGVQTAGPDASQAREAELSEAHRRLAAELDAMRQEISDAGVDSTLALRFAELAGKAYDSEAVARGRIDGPVISAEALGYLSEAKEVEPAATFDLALAEGGIHRRLGDDEAALAAFVAAFAAEPRMEAFSSMVGLSRSAGADAAVVTACATIRPEISDEGLADFVGLCLERSGGDASGLTWKGADRDVVAYNTEMARREEAARVAEEERRKEEELAAAAAAEEATKRELYQVAAVFAAGRCEFGDCAHRGWSVRVDQGEVKVSCSFGDCLTRGWEARFPDGKTARTDCSFGECLQRGWQTRFPDGSTAQTSCSFGECATRGWETRLPDGSTSRTTCSFSECFTRGWETSLPNGGRIRCTCSFGECLTRGTECS